MNYANRLNTIIILENKGLRAGTLENIQRFREYTYCRRLRHRKYQESTVVK